MNLESKCQKILLKKALFLAGLAFLGGCSFAPKYARPTVETPAVFKENSGTNMWEIAQPDDAAVRSNWWSFFNDAQLNSLEEQVTISNQNVAAAFANFLSARALVKEAQAQLFPSLVANPSVARTRSSLGGQTGSPSHNPNTTDYSLPLDASWQLDLWGRIRNTIKASAAEAQASAADLENTRLTAQAELALDYFQLRGQDALEQLFDDTVSAYQQSYDLEKVLFKTGIASDQDVAQAETQLETAQAQDTNLGILRAQLEHAIAMLIGKPPADVSIPRAPLNANPPAIPSGIPSQLLERRPDIAAAERLVAAANAQIGVAKAAYFPTITLSASGGFESVATADLFSWPSRVWSIGAGASETIFDAGARAATVAQYHAAYDNAVAQYRQTVLTAFQQVEDNLASLRILNEEIQQQDVAVKSSGRYLALAQDRYKLGIDSYLNVITAQATLLANRQTLANLRTEQMTAAVQLIEALGGGWDAAQLTSKKPGGE
jgi:NodT family efflux transporter outer membrane factor (OMF) lipoprotein